MSSLWVQKILNKFLTKNEKKPTGIADIPREEFELIIDAIIHANIGYFSMLTNNGLYCPIDIRALVIAIHNDHNERLDNEICDMHDRAE